MPQPAEVAALSDQIRSVYAEAWRQIDEAQQAIAADPSRWRAQRRLAELRRSIEQAMDQIDGQARTWVAEQFPLAYGMGAMSAASTVGGSFSWTAPHTAAVQALAQQTWDDLLAASNGVRRSVRLMIGKLARQQTIATVAGGQTAQQAAGVLADLAEGRGIWSVRYSDGSLHGLDDYSDMLIRTRSALAYNSGALTESRESGVGWMECADGAACGLDGHDEPPLANGLILTTDEAFDHPLSHPRCVVDGTPVQPLGAVLAGYRSFYRGPTISIRTARGFRLTVTPNHPILTGRGWVPADSLTEGDDVLSRSTPIGSPLLPGHDLDHMESMAEQVFQSLLRPGHHARVVSSPADFHGDGRGMEKEIDVVWTDGLLPGVTESMTVETRTEGVLVVAGPQLPRLSGPGPLLLRGERFYPHLRRSPAGFHVAGVAPAGPYGDSSVLEAELDDGLGDAGTACHISERFAVDVALDQVIEIRNDHSHVGHVTDFTTAGGAYLAGGVVVHNCRRAWLARPDITSAEQAADATPSTTAAQREDQAAAEQARADALAARRGRLQRTSGLQRRQELLAKRAARVGG